MDMQLGIAKSRWKRIKDWGSYILLLILVFGAIVRNIVDIKDGTTVPSIGVMVNLIGLAASSTPIQWSRLHIIRCYAGYAIAAIGFALYTVRGGLGIRYRGFKNPSFDISVTQGCPSGAFTDWVGNYLCATPQPYNFPYSDNQDIFGGTVSWILGLGCGIIVIGHAVSGFSKRIWIKLRFTNFAFMLMVIGSGLAVIAKAINSGSVTVDYDDCRNAQQRSDGYWAGCVASQITFAGSISGFWTPWVQDKAAVAGAIFAWE
jgi:hypothetical protein